MLSHAVITVTVGVDRRARGPLTWVLKEAPTRADYSRQCETTGTYPRV